MGQGHYSFYYIDSTEYFVVLKIYRYPSHLINILEDREAFEAGTTITYETYLRRNSDLFQIVNGDFYETEFNIDEIIAIIEDEGAEW